MEDQVNRAIQGGATLLLGGSRPPLKPISSQSGESLHGHFFLPTVLSNVSIEGSPFEEETFGPVVPLMKFKTEEDAIDIANRTK